MNKANKQPYVRFYFSDWLAATAGMTGVEKGVYITLLALMYERCEPLTDDPRRLARSCGVSPSTFKNALSMLKDDGKITDQDGGLWNKRVGREFEYRAKKSEVASGAAKQRWRKDQQNQAPPDANAVQPHSERIAIPETRSQKPDTTSGSNEPGGASPAVEANAWLFAEGLKYLTGNGVAERQARSLLGKWRKSYSDMATMQAISAAMKVAASNPVPYVEAVLKRGNPTPVVVTQDGRKVRSVGP